MRERMGHVPVALAASGAVLVVAVLVAWLARGGAAAAGAAAGVALVVVSYLISSLTVAWADSINPQLVLSVGLATYVIKIALLGVAMVAIVGTGWGGTTAMGLAIIAGVIGWTTAHVWWGVRRAREADRQTRQQPVSRGSGHAAGWQE